MLTNEEKDAIDQQDAEILALKKLSIVMVDEGW